VLKPGTPWNTKNNQDPRKNKLKGLWIFADQIVVTDRHFGSATQHGER